MATDEEVEAAKKGLSELRARVEDARLGGTEHQRSVDNDITLMQLEAERARLEAELAVANEAKKVTVVRAGAAGPLSIVKDQMQAAVAHQKAVAKEIAANKPTRNQATPTDADSTNTTTDSQAENKSAAAKTQAGVKNEEGASK